VTRVQIYVCGDVQDLLCAVLHVCYPPGFPGLLLLSWLLLRAALGACLPHACMFCCQACVLAVGFVCGCLVLVLVAVMMLMHHCVSATKCASILISIQLLCLLSHGILLIIMCILAVLMFQKNSVSCVPVYVSSYLSWHISAS
jgi:hypothetical protein